MPTTPPPQGPPPGWTPWPQQPPQQLNAPVSPQQLGFQPQYQQPSYQQWAPYGQPGPPRRNKTREAFGTAVAVIAITVGIIWWTGSGSSSNPDNHVTGTSLTSSQLDQAYEACKGAVNSQLKAPATASYPNFATNTTDIHVVNNGGGDYTISSQVDSENGFGAKLRTFFSCDAQTSDGTRWATTATLMPQ